MTERLKGCWVAFDEDIRVDDAQDLFKAIRCLRGVQAVTGSKIDSADWMARERVRHELTEALWEVLNPKRRDGA